MMYSDAFRQQHPHHLGSYYSNHNWSSEGTESLVQALQQHGRRSSSSQVEQYQRQQQQQDARGARQFAKQSLLVPQIQSPGGNASHTFRAVAQPQRSDSGEHMLRRKTPNGTLSAGYDGTPVEWASGPSANKHLLMPREEAAGYSAYRNTDTQSNAASLSRRSDCVGEEVNWRPGWNQAVTMPQVRTGYGLHSEDAHAKWWQHGQPPSLDSMLHQGPTVQYFYNGVGYHQVPTVVPQMWPPSIGPTASNAQGPFGPYWPNGAYEPYRPAPLRDTRFNSQFASINLNDPSETSSRRNSRKWAGNAPLPLPPQHADHLRHAPPPERPPPLFDEQFTIAASSAPPPPPPQQQHDPGYTYLHRGHEQARPSIEGQYGRVPFKPSASAPPQGNTNNHWTQTEPSRLFYSSEHSTPQASQDNLQFRDKTLVWAHRVYVNLLQSVQQSRRHSQTAHQPSERRHSHQLPYLPKPPRYTSVSSDVINTSSRKNSVAATPGSAQNQGTKPRQSSEGDNNRRASINGPYQSFTANPRTNFHERFDRGLRLSSQTPNHLPAGTPSFQQSNGLSSPSLLQFPAFQTSPHNHSPALEAQAAFEMLSRLVRESSWQWIDGMLLGGCLAYGLGDHKSAFEWYSRVLVCDPNHVEATSNLAATLAMLGQLKEAEQCWLRAVKLRPSYFEAVEHLVGLLCQDQRGRDAVRVIEYMESCLKVEDDEQNRPVWELVNERANALAKSNFSASFDADKSMTSLSLSNDKPVFSGYRAPSVENGRLIALIHAKGNMLYGLGDNVGASRAFEDAVMIAAGKGSTGISGLIKHILRVFGKEILACKDDPSTSLAPCEAILLLPNMALKTAELVFPGNGLLPGFRDVPDGQPRKAAISVASNSLLSLAKIYQDGMSSSSAPSNSAKTIPGVQDILALYYLSLSLQPSPSTANNVGILLAGVQQSVPPKSSASSSDPDTPVIPGVVPGSGIALALAYYNYGLNLDNRHAHLYTNLGSLLKDIGQLNAAIKMYEQAVVCDGNFDIALANLANAVKDQGRISDAIGYYKRAVAANPEFAEAVCGLANALNSVCSWNGRGGVSSANWRYDRWHVDEQGMLLDAGHSQSAYSGWVGRVVSIVEKQLKDGKTWGRGVLQTREMRELFDITGEGNTSTDKHTTKLPASLFQWIHDAGQDWEGARVVRVVERATKCRGWQIYQEKYVKRTTPPQHLYTRPQVPSALAVPSAPTVLPFHTFTCPLTASQIRKISQRNGLRISCSTLRAPWLPTRIFEPPAPPSPQLNVGYVSSDFNNHPLAHLMQSVFGFHDTSKVKAFCYATTNSDNSSHRKQIEREAPVFRDASSWPLDRLVKQILDDNIHILINLNGYTRGARNEVFAARPAPIQMSFMGFAGTLGAEWCDYLLADTTSIPPSTLRPYRRNVDLADLTHDENYASDQSEWVYGENVIYARDTFFCCDHRQSAPDSQEKRLSWAEEQRRRAKMRKELFPELADDAVILGNFNQLYKIEPTTFRTWLRILQSIPTAVLWLLRFPDLGEQNLRQTAAQWSSPAVASRILFTDVAPKHQHISRARVCDLFLDTPECNAHTTAADVLWSGTPLLTLPRYGYKMCSRMAASILKGALPRGEAGDRAARDLIAADEAEYEERAVEMGNALACVLRREAAAKKKKKKENKKAKAKTKTKTNNEEDEDEDGDEEEGEGEETAGEGDGKGEPCRLLELRRLLYEGRWQSPLFDTRRWVRDLEEAYAIAWQRWVDGEGGDIWLKQQQQQH